MKKDNKMDAKERIAIPRQKMPEQDPAERKHNYEEVTYGFTEELAKQEARRCLRCKNPKCVEGCPVNIRIPDFIALIEEGKFLEAARKIKEQDSLPAVTGRVCPQETQCEFKCVLAHKGNPVSIGALERFAADYEREFGNIKLPKIAPKTGKSVAVIGAGPAGLTAAGDLIKLGHRIVVFEALHQPGGVLMYGIPEFRMPKKIVQAEIAYLTKLGVRIRTDYIVGKLSTVDELLENGYDAVFIGTGAGLPMFMGIPGENLVGVYSANEYLTRSNLMKAFLFPEYGTSPIHSKKAVTVGGGNVAMDSARTAVRMGAQSTVVYRRSRKEMPARDEEIHHAEEEGVVFHFLTNPKRVLGDGNGRVAGIECLRMELGEPDDSGRRRPIPVEGSEFVIEADTIIPALGNKPNPIVPMTTPDLEITKWKTIIVDEKTGKTSKDRVWAAGDIVSGAATVILAMGQARIAAKSIHEYLTNMR